MSMDCLNVLASLDVFYLVYIPFFLCWWILHRSLRGFRDAALYVFRSYGLRGFLRGTGARMMYAAPGAAISWMTYEWAKKLFGIPPDFELVEV